MSHELVELVIEKALKSALINIEIAIQDCKVTMADNKSSIMASERDFKALLGRIDFKKETIESEKTRLKVTESKLEHLIEEQRTLKELVDPNSKKVRLNE